MSTKPVTPAKAGTGVEGSATGAESAPVVDSNEVSSTTNGGKRGTFTSGLLAAISTCLLILEGVLAVLTASSADEKVVALVRGAIDNLAEVKDTPVMRQQVENLRLHPRW